MHALSRTNYSAPYTNESSSSNWLRWLILTARADAWRAHLGCSLGIMFHCGSSYIYICERMYVYIYMHAHGRCTHTCICTCIYIYINLFTPVSTCICVNGTIYTQVHIHINTTMYIYIYTHIPWNAAALQVSALDADTLQKLHTVVTQVAGSKARCFAVA